ncbi:hypothetical protein HPP92_018563 [Vanilla planifolia]|uniref:Chromo domain-containing protein n=1 Tax=Vanilla planifolia TaxID=51239 RepID=A0A835QDT4_VANPL|nr:hypothetical protein HPP92_018563 [Vanilla planifolia]
MIRVRPERFPPGTLRKLHAKGIGPFRIITKISPNAYTLELPDDYGVSNTFNISDLVAYKEPVEIPSEPFEPESPPLVSEPLPECPQACFKKASEQIEKIIDDKITNTRNKQYRKYLVHWKDRLNEDDTWISREELHRLNLEHLKTTR